MATRTKKRTRAAVDAADAKIARRVLKDIKKNPASVVKGAELAAWLKALDGPEVNLATRIPKPLYQRLKLLTTTREVLMREFVVAAVAEKLVRDKKSTAA